ncbi:MAG: hypothetical protein FJ096_20230 [Deltaproteobacteria bacterium]|nr:hypothetical protein [Deltaproteobacteria bacterium]
MTLGASFLKPALAPLNFANVSMMGRLITSGLRELAADNLLKQLQAGIEAAAADASVRASDVVSVIPMARFQELARRLDAHQRLAVGAWEDRPVESKRTGDLANLTEHKNLPTLSDSLMRLATMANANPELRMALYEMSHIARDWQALVLESGNKLDDDRVLRNAYRKRTLRRGFGALVLVAVAVAGGVIWQKGEAARRRVGAQIGTEDPCAVGTIDPADRLKATAEQLASIERRRGECEAKHAKLAAEKAEREREAEHARQCSDLTDTVKAGKAPSGITVVPAKVVAFVGRVATGALEPSDLGPDNPVFPCPEAGGVPAMQKAYDLAVVRSKLWVSHEDMNERATGAVRALQSEIPKALKRDIADDAEKIAVDALVDQRPIKMRRAKRLCGYKETFGFKLRPFCTSVLR